MHLFIKSSKVEKACSNKHVDLNTINDLKADLVISGSSARIFIQKEFKDFFLKTVVKKESHNSLIDESSSSVQSFGHFFCFFALSAL